MAKVFGDEFDLMWTTVTSYVKDAVVFMDSAAAECLHWNGGVETFLKNDAVTVFKFTPFMKLDSKATKAVFMVSSPLVGYTLQTLKILVESNNFTKCIVISSLPKHCLFEGNEEGLQHLETLLLSWMSTKNGLATALHIPFLSATVSQNCFLIPAFSEIFSIYHCGLLNFQTTQPTEIASKNLLSPGMQIGVKNFSAAFFSMLEYLQIKPDVFTLGPVSHFVGSELEILSRALKKKVNCARASVVFIDRNLDLAGPLSHACQSQFDYIIRAFPHIPGHVFDVAIPMNDLAACKSDIVFGRPLLANGCLAPKTKLELSVLEYILYQNPKEAVNKITKTLVETSGKESMYSMSNDIYGRLMEEILLYKDNPECMRKYSTLLQQALAVVKTLSNTYERLPHLQAAENGIMQMFAYSSDEALMSIVKFITEEDKKMLDIKEVLHILAYFYMVSGYNKENSKSESLLQEALWENLIENVEAMEKFGAISVHDESDEENKVRAVRKLLALLKKLGSLRNKMKKYNSVLTTQPVWPGIYKPLLKQVLKDILDVSSAEIPDVEYHSSGFGDYIKSGFSLLLNVMKVKPRDNPLIMIIVLGGITPAEIKLAHEMSAHRDDVTVIFGSTDILTPESVFHQLSMILKELTKESED